MKAIWIALLLAAVVCSQTSKPPATKANAKAAQKTQPKQSSPNAAAPVTALPAAKSGYDVGVKLPPPSSVKMPPHEAFSLDNGLRVIFGEDHELPMVQGALFVSSGTVHAPAEFPALPEMVARTLRLGGVRGLSGQQFEDRLGELGITMRADAGPTFTTISFSAPTSSAAAVLDLLRRMLTEPAYPVEAIELAQSQMHELVDRRNDRLADLSARAVNQYMFDSSTPYGRQIEHDGLDRIGREELREFQAARYVPSNSVLMIHGDLSRQSLTVLSNWAGVARLGPPLPPIPPAPPTAVYLSNVTKSERSVFIIALRAGKLSLRESAAMSVASELFGSGFDRIERGRQLNWGLVFNNQVSRSFESGTLFQIRGSSRASTVTGSIQMSFRALERLSAGEFTDVQLAEAKTAALRAIAARYPRPRDVLADAALLVLSGSPAEEAVIVQREIAALTKAEIVRAAKSLNPARAVISVAGDTSDQLQPLTDLGYPIRNLDMSITQSKPAEARSDEAALEQARQWLAKLRGALGGDDALAKLRDYKAVFSGTVLSTGGAVPVRTTDTWVLQGALRQEQILPGSNLTIFYDGKIGWISSDRNIAALPPYLVRQVEGNLFRLPWLIASSGRDSKQTVGYLGSGTLLIRDDAGNSVRVFLDEEDGRLLRTRYLIPQANGSSILAEDRFSEWVDAGSGLRLPSRVVTFQNGFPVRDLKVERFQVNANLTVREVESKP